MNERAMTVGEVDHEDEILVQREEILKAFIAKYGIEPDKIVQVSRRLPNGTVNWSVREKTDAEILNNNTFKLPKDSEDLPPSPFSEELIISAARTAREDLLVGIGEPTASLLEIKKKLDAIERVVNRLENDEISNGN